MGSGRIPRRLIVLTALLLAGGTRRALVTNDAELRDALAGDAARIELAPGRYAATTIARAVTLAGVDTPLGAGGPEFDALTVAARDVEVSGVQLRGTLVVNAPSRITRVSVRGAETGIDLTAAATLDQFLVTACGTGVRVRAAASVTNGLVVHNSGSGIVVTAPATLAHLTVADNGGAGVELHGGGAMLINSALAGNGKAAIVQRGGEPRYVAHLLLAAQRALYDGDEAYAEAVMPVSCARDEEVAQLLPGDRQTFDPPLTTRGIFRATLRRAAPWRGGSDFTDPRAALAAYAPSRPLPRADRDYVPALDAAGTPRAAASRLGALESAPPSPPARVLVVSPDGDDSGDGSEAHPLRSVQTALDRGGDGALVRVLPGRYQEALRVDGADAVIEGVRRIDGALVPIADTREPRPHLDPSPTGAAHFALFLRNVTHASRVSGLTIERAATGVVILGETLDAPPAPLFEHLVVRETRRGIDADDTHVKLRDSLFEDNTTAVVVRSVGSWRIERNRFERNGTAIALQYTMPYAPMPFVIAGNDFIDSDLRIDALMTRPMREFRIERNHFTRSSLRVYSGQPDARVVIAGNAFDEHSFVELEEGALPRVEVDDASHVRRHAAREAPALPPGRVWPHSAAIALSPVSGGPRRLYAVAADFGGVGVFNAGRDVAPAGFVATGADPHGLALTPDGSLLLVANLGSGDVAFVDTKTLAVTRRVAVGSEPYGIVIDGERAYVTLSGDAQVVALDLRDGAIVARSRVHALPRGVAVYRRKLFVTHFGGGPARVTVLDLPRLGGRREIAVPPIASERFPTATPTLMQSVVIRGSRAYLPSFGAVAERPEHAVIAGRALLPFETTTQPLLTVIDTDRERIIDGESANLTLHSQSLNGPYDIAFGDSGRAYVPLYGSDCVVRLAVRVGAPPEPVRAWRASIDLMVGSNPRGVAVDEASRRLYSVNFASGDVSVVDLDHEAEIMRLPLGPRERDRLDSAARRGKQLFYTTFSVRTATNFWVSCGGCHPDGRTDNVTWRLDAGHRSTPMLAGALETLPLHFDADRDELADFEHTVRALQGGFGLIDGRIPGERGAAKEPASDAWRDIAAYLREGVDAPRAPAPTGREAAGHATFARLHCDSCHGGAHFTSSSLAGDPRRDVGTGGRFDPPSLWGLAQTAPYLHDGRAATLYEVLRNNKHLFAGLSAPAPVSERQRHDLIDYLRSIDGSAQ